LAAELRKRLQKPLINPLNRNPDIPRALLGMKADAVKIRILARPYPAKNVMKITLGFGDPLLGLSFHAEHALCA
jgi:hypothetical protein